MTALQDPSAEWGWPFFDAVMQEGATEKSARRRSGSEWLLAHGMQRGAFAVNTSCSLPTRLPKRLLLAEDDVDLRALLSMTLRREGYEVIEVGCGEGLVASLLGNAKNGLGIDVVLTDVRMPKKSGLEALAWMRGSMLRIPTIVISAFCDHAIHVKARGLGALAVLEKPVELGKLRTVLRTYFEREESAY